MIDARDIISRINRGATLAAERGRTPVVARVGDGGLVALMTYLGNQCEWVIRDGKNGLRIYTDAGPVHVRGGASLYDAVIVEDETGEPYPVDAREALFG